MTVGVIAICASGPSLCRDDVYRLRDNKIPIVTVNSSWMIYPDCQYIFAGDDAWWDKNNYIISSLAQKWTCSETVAQEYGLNYFENRYGRVLNSGLVAILFAMSLGAENIILLGYDCSLEKGIHWHGKHHELNNPTDYNIRRWKAEFETLASEIRNKVNIVNCSSESRLPCFPMATLEKTLRRIKKQETIHR